MASMKDNQQKLIVLHLIETGGPGGAENILIEMSANLDKKRFHSIVLLRKKGWLHDRLIEKNIETYVFHEDGYGVLFLIKLIRLIRDKKINIIQAHEFLMSLYATVAGLLTLRPVVATFHGKYYYWEKKRRKIAMRLISRFGQIVTVSKELKLFIAEKINIPPERVKVIYNGIDLEKYSNTQTSSLKKSDFGIENNKKIICTIGNLYPVKGHIYLIKAIPEVIKQYPNVVFLFAGRGEEKKKLIDEITKLRVTKYIKLLGFRSDIPELLKLADLFVLPSLAESLSLAILEAMALKTPAIVTDVGGNREIIDDQKTGYIVPSADSDALAKKIVNLLNDKNKMKALAESSRRAIENKFSKEAMLYQYERLYETCLNIVR